MGVVCSICRARNANVKAAADAGSCRRADDRFGSHPALEVLRLHDASRAGLHVAHHQPKLYLPRRSLTQYLTVWAENIHILCTSGYSRIASRIAIASSFRDSLVPCSQHRKMNMQLSGTPELQVPFRVAHACAFSQSCVPFSFRLEGSFVTRQTHWKGRVPQTARPILSNHSATSLPFTRTSAEGSMSGTRYGLLEASLRSRCLALTPVPT